MGERENYNFKVVIFGELKVIGSPFIEKFTSDHKTIFLDRSVVQAEFAKIGTSFDHNAAENCEKYLKGSVCIMMVYDVDDRGSLRRVREGWNILKNHYIRETVIALIEIEPNSENGESALPESREEASSFADANRILFVRIGELDDEFRKIMKGCVQTFRDFKEIDSLHKPNVPGDGLKRLMHHQISTLDSCGRIPVRHDTVQLKEKRLKNLENLVKIAPNYLRGTIELAQQLVMKIDSCARIVDGLTTEELERLSNISDLREIEGRWKNFLVSHQRFAFEAFGTSSSLIEQMDAISRQIAIWQNNPSINRSCEDEIGRIVVNCERVMDEFIEKCRDESNISKEFNDAYENIEQKLESCYEKLSMFSEGMRA
ncbi:15921_t:CDS:2 [Acaulospora morrowiae]|uniref:15921_t:CDS:1 n=1 Tax=Acaulospora morrowiae TaxID=94023 RepID=A0A9N8YQH4_9GLOM|nr:15921_t:CDS:2 [Acaulospora morrowiae]